jgi:murein DD-endopeptidase MepM/ murein hydrolase activator NlpD
MAEEPSASDPAQETVLRKSTDGAPRVEPTARTTRTRMSPATRLNRRAIASARATQAWLGAAAAAPATSLRAILVAALRPLATAERALPLAIAAAVAAAALLAVVPGTPAGSVGGVQGRGQDVRIAVNGAPGRDIGPVDVGSLDARYSGDTSFTPFSLPDEVLSSAEAEQATADAGSFLDDGTLVTGYAPDTTVEDGSDLIVKYKVKSGDTLSTIARKFDVSMMTLWWANKLKSKDDLHVGQTLKIPPVSGLVVTVSESDTLDSLAAKYDAKASRIKAVNQLTDDTLVVGQVLMVPGAKGDPIPTPKPTPKPKATTHSRSSTPSRTSGRTGSSYGGHYSGGRMHWPVVGGGNYVSQYFHYGHSAIDIAADYGSPVVAANGGRVYFAGWKSNGGGYQVWISHGSGVYTTYNHMSSLSVGTGQWVGRGQRVGRIGQSGWATGPHLHFEVWVGGVPWSGGHPVNPMRYF